MRETHEATHREQSVNQWQQIHVLDDRKEVTASSQPANTRLDSQTLIYATPFRSCSSSIGRRVLCESGSGIREVCVRSDAVLSGQRIHRTGGTECVCKRCSTGFRTDVSTTGQTDTILSSTTDSQSAVLSNTSVHTF